MAEEKKKSTPGPTFYVLAGEEIAPATAEEVKKLDALKIELFLTEKEAQDVRDGRIKGRVMREYQIARAKAKVEAERKAFAIRKPDRARKLARLETEAREVAAEKKPAKTIKTIEA